MEIIQKLDNRIICRLPSIQSLNDDFISRLAWPAGIEKYIVLSNAPINYEWETLSGITGVDRVWLVYSAIRAEIAAGAERQAQFVETPFPLAQELAALFSETRLAYYRSINRELTERQLAESKAFVEKVLPGSRRIGLQKDGVPIALIMLVEAKDYDGKPVDWVPWVWIERTLASKEREIVHNRFRQWLKAGALERVQCSISSSNSRSQKFFRKLGFKPECIHILKEKR